MDVAGAIVRKGDPEQVNRTDGVVGDGEKLSV